MDTILYLIKTMPLIFTSVVFFVLFLFFFILQYIYINMNLKGICKTIFDDENTYKKPLEIFNFYFLSVLPLVFWRETLNIKMEIKFKKLYRKGFYFKIEKRQLVELMDKYPYLFYIQYLIFIFGLLWIVTQSLAYLLNNF